MLPDTDSYHMPWLKPREENLKKAVAYYRHSAQDRQENSIEIQQDQVRKFAAEHGIRIIREFADRGISGLSVEGRDGFSEMLHDYVEGGKEEFEYILVLDVSRWGRFQETDLSAYYSGLCAQHGKHVVFTSLGFAKNDDLLHGLHLSIERYRSAQYSRELSGKVWKGQQKITSQGYWGGGMPPYAMRRLLLDEQRNPVRPLKRGERKAIQNQRVTLVPGDEREVEAVRLIFNRFVNDARTPDQVAVELNGLGIASPGGAAWSRSAVCSVLRNEIYKGWNVWNKTTQKLHSRTRRNASGDWIRVPDSFDPVVPPEVFDLAQSILRAKEEEELNKYSDKYMLGRFQEMWSRYGIVNRKLISADKGLPSHATYVNRYHSLDLAYQAIHREVIQTRKMEAVEMLKDGKINIAPFDDLIVVEGLFTLLVEPAVAISKGYEAYWVFHPHLRKDADLVVGIPLTAPQECEAMGYLFFPRLFFRRRVRISTTMDYELSLHAHAPIELMAELRR